MKKRSIDIGFALFMLFGSFGFMFIYFGVIPLYKLWIETNIIYGMNYGLWGSLWRFLIYAVCFGAGGGFSFCAIIALVMGFIPLETDDNANT